MNGIYQVGASTAKGGPNFRFVNRGNGKAHAQFQLGQNVNRPYGAAHDFPEDTPIGGFINGVYDSGAAESTVSLATGKTTYRGLNIRRDGDRVVVEGPVSGSVPAFMRPFVSNGQLRVAFDADAVPSNIRSAL